MALPFACHEFTSKVARETPKSAIVGTCFRGLIVVLRLNQRGQESLFTR